MSDAAVELSFTRADEAEAIPLGLPEVGAETTPHENPAQETGSKMTGIAAAVAAGFSRVRAGLAGLRGTRGEEGDKISAMGAGAQAADDNGPAPQAEGEVRPGSSGGSSWRPHELLAATSGVALAAAAIAVVALWPNGGGSSSGALEKGAEPGLVAPASKLAGVPLRERVDPPVLEVPPAAPPQKIVEEVESFWTPGAQKAHDQQPPASSQQASSAAPAVTASSGEIGVRASATAAEPPKTAVVGVSGAPVVEQQPPQRVAVAPAAPAQVSEPVARPKEEASRRVATIAPDAPAKVDERTLEQETKLYSMITELSTLVRRTREELAALQETDKRTARAVEAKLTDFERRLNLGEAQRALDAAKAVPTGPKDAPASPSAGGATKDIVTASLATHAAPTAPSPGARYRVQAASPGLAMLSEIDRSGEDVAPLQVAVGANVPGYGRVTKISQRGTEWIVLTEKGPIR